MCCNLSIPYNAKFWQGTTLANQLFQSFGKENVGEFTIANVSYFSESRIWQDKILVNGVRFIKFAKVFPYQNFALYGTCVLTIRTWL